MRQLPLHSTKSTQRNAIENEQEKEKGKENEYELQEAGVRCQPVDGDSGDGWDLRIKSHIKTKRQSKRERAAGRHG